MKKPAYTKVRFTKSVVALLLALVCVITLLPQGSLIAQAETQENAIQALVEAPSIVRSSSNTLWVNGSNYATDNSLDAIKWHYASAEGKYYLYLPSSVNLNQLTVWHTFSNSMYVNGTKIESGETTNIFAGGGNYTVKAGSTSYSLTVMQSQNINTMFITTASGSLDGVNASTNKTVVDSGDIVYVDTKGNAAKVTMSQIKGRGNSSWEAAQRLFYKYPYNIKLGTKTSIFGMKKSKKWCLLANDFDQSLIRNKFIYDLAQDAGAAYTPECEYADVYQNGRYIGNYLVTSKVDVDSNRVNISDLESETEDVNSQELETYSRGGDISSVSANTYKYVNIPNNPSDITGGYLLEFELDERYPNEISGFVSSRRQQIVVNSPEYASKEQVTYIKKYFQSMEDAVYSSSGYNSEGKYYTEYMDLKSAAQMYIIQELAMNVDAVSTSFYMYKDKNGKIFFGPAWDFDWAIGGYNKSELLNTSKLLLTSKKVYNGSELNFMGALTSHSDFMNMVKKVWVEDFSPLLKVSTGTKAAYTENVKSIKAYGAEIESSANMNFNRFKFLGTAYWGSVNTGNTFSANIDYVNNFIKQRVNYLNSIWGSGGSGGDVTTTVYFDNSTANWSNVYAYVWNDTTDFSVFSGSLVSGTNNIYKFTITGSYSSILFKNTDGTTNWDKQTLDLTMPADNQSCYKPNNGSSKSGGSWYTFAETTPTPVVTKEPTPTPVVTVEPTKTPGSTKTIAAFDFDNTGKVADEDLDEYTNGTDTYTYLATTGNGTLTGTITGEASKHLTWSTDDYKAEDGSAVGISPAFGASKTNNWTSNAAVTITTNTTGYKTLKVSLQLGATKKGPANYAIYATNGTTTQKIGTYTLAGNKTLYNVTLDIPETFADQNNVSILVKLENTTTVAGADLSENPTGGEFAINHVAITGVSTSEPVVTTAPTKTPVVTQTPAGTVVYFDNSAANWTEVYAYVWNDTTDYKLFNPVTVSNNIYTFNITGSYSKILFKNTEDTTTWNLQTSDLVMPTTSANCYKPSSGANKASGSWYAYAEPTKTPVVTTAPTKTPVVTQTPAGTVVYFDNSAANWTEVYAYVWNDTTDYKLFEPVTVSNKIYTFNITGSYSKILFKNTGDTATWNLQTSDLVMPTTSANCYKPSSGANKASGSWYAYAEPTKTPVVTTAPTAVPTNEITLYYSTGWTKPYCHYKVGNGAWTTVPGKEMSATSEQSGYNWKIAIDLGSATNATICFTNGSGSWDSNNGSNYVISAGTYGVKNGVISKLTPVTNPIVTATPKVTTEPTKTPVVTTAPTKTPVVTTAPTKTPVVTTAPTAVPTNAITLYYSTGWTKAYCHYKVGSGSWTTVPGKAMSATSEQSGYNWKITIDLGSATNATVCFTNGSNSWDSNNGSNYVISAGTYGVKNGVISTLKSVATPTPIITATPKVTTAPTKTPVVTTAPTAVPTNEITLYYSTSWTKAYCHYKVGSGSWTTVPGKAMSATSEQSGYNWKITIDLGSATNATVCFTNGSNSWDSNNGSNYVISAGTYGVKNGVISTLKSVATPTPIITATPKVTTAPTKTPVVTTEPTKTPVVTTAPTAVPTNEITLYYSTSWTKAYCHYKVGSGSWTTVPGKAMSATSEQSGYNWKIAIDLGSATNATVCFTNGSGSWDSNNGSNYVISAGTYGVKNGVISKLTPVSNPVVTSTPEVASNQVVVYYTRSSSTSWSNAYIHYQANGKWTSTPGVKMTKISSGKWMYTIDLESTSSATVCFTNGSGTWDNNSQKNYVLSKGTYEIKGGVITKITQ